MCKICFKVVFGYCCKYDYDIEFVFGYSCECKYEIGFVFGVAGAASWFGAILTIFFGEFCWTVTARNTTSHWDHGVVQSSLSTDDD